MFKRVFVCILLLNSLTSFCFGIKYERVELIKEFGIGNKQNELGYQPVLNQGIPLGIGFNHNADLFISDNGNMRLIVFDSNLNYKVSFSDRKYWKYFFALQFFFDKDNNCYIIYDSFNFNKLNADFKPVFSIVLDKICKYQFNDNFFFAYKNYVFDYTENGELVCIINPNMDNKNNKENFLDPEQTQKLFTKDNNNNLEGLTLDNKGRLFLNGELITRDYRVFIEYWKEKHNDGKLGKSHTKLNFNPESLFPVSPLYLGKDNNGNYYWLDSDAIVIFNNNGWCIDYFLPKNHQNMRTIPTVHPSGDIYYLGFKYSKNKLKKSDKYAGDVEYYPVIGFYLYRVKNVWDPKGRAKWYRESGVRDLKPLKEGN